jgi:hypothetical protein
MQDKSVSHLLQDESQIIGISGSALTTMRAAKTITIAVVILDFLIDENNI